MIEKPKPTPGPWVVKSFNNPTVQPNDDWTVYGPGGQSICMEGNGTPEDGSNANLICEAGTVHHECGLSPRELLERCQAMEAALNQIIEMNQQWADDQWGDRAKAESMACVKAARAALAKHKEV